MEITATEVGMIAGLIMILSAGAKGVWVWGWHYRDCQKERDEWKDIALSGTLLAERSVDIIEAERDNPHAHPTRLNHRR